MARDYIEAICESDIVQVDGVGRSPMKARALLRSYARNTSTQAADATLQEDIRSSGESMSSPTLTNYLSALDRLFVTEDAPAWSPALRSRSAIRTSPTRHLVDPSLAVAAMGASPDQLLGDLETMGLLFESLCIRDLRIYASRLGGTIYHFRDKSGLEADAVVVLGDARYGLVEVKMGKTRVDQGVESLGRLEQRLDGKVMGKPSFKLVLTTGNYPYVTREGIYVVPLGCLGP
jgi:predicted AAA+ superfamily ATPase